MTRACDSEPERRGRQGTYEISVREDPQRLLAAARQRTTFKRISQEIGRLLEPVWAFIRTGEFPGCGRMGTTSPSTSESSCRALAELGLIDEYEFVVHPRIAGHGPTLFAGLSKPLDLKLGSQLELGSGALAMRYEPRS